jgi:hypothetical protein
MGQAAIGLDFPLSLGEQVPVKMAGDIPVKRMCFSLA